MIFRKRNKETGVPIQGQDVLFVRPYIWLIPLTITALNFLITYNLKEAEALFVLYFILDFAISFLTIKFYALGIGVLDRKVPLDKDFVKRVLYQFTAHTLAVVVFNVLMNELFDNIFFSGELLSLSFAFYTQDVPLAVIFLLLFHSAYFGLYLMSERGKNKEGNASTKMKIKVLNGTAFVLLSFEEIQCIYSQFGATYIINHDLNKCTSEKTLKDFEEMVPSNFFRANRQIIISNTAIKAYKSSSYGKIELDLKPLNTCDIEETIFISRDKASSFRAWFRQTHNVD
ncbi:LytTR family DNA-binding domain-containing protein [Flagellimonas sp. CMM7]|uniref:LytTR family DNA-binding domain-containing protein n=1 Tax=Flagellimonas sp. CMM7 TaxID=2654676 RepID=UPI0013D78147|nr:LytTR family DNA-binding domain-containing protein [Flagellimonas sp. CMM7]UII81397.1 LytTR family transcriptional regulator DNA-binding domain-containing protein [Flagellimonas sp. CMM7]